MKVETFADGSTIETDETEGNRTVCGQMAHDEYFKRLANERQELINQTKNEN
jgi:hypothetical protein